MILIIFIKVDFYEYCFQADKNKRKTRKNSPAYIEENPSSAFAF